VAVAGTTLVLATLGARRIDVTWYGKAGTFGLMFAFPLFLAGSSDIWWHQAGQVAAWVCGIPGLVLSYYAAFTTSRSRPRPCVPAERTARASRGAPAAPPPADGCRRPWRRGARGITPSAPGTALDRRSTGVGSVS
jgi:hypothetical protein